MKVDIFLLSKLDVIYEQILFTIFGTLNLDLRIRVTLTIPNVKQNNFYHL